MGLLATYVRAFRDEPKMRSYALACLASDIGLVAFGWAGELVQVNLFKTQADRARIMIPTMLAFLLGAIVSGPLADWAERFSFARLARWRWRLVMCHHVGSLAIALYLLLALSRGQPAIGLLLPYMMAFAFLKTGFGATENAFFVDLLTHESVQRGPDGQALLDERGEPRQYKTHLLSMSSFCRGISALGTLGALVAGGVILRASSGRLAPLVAVDVVANVACLVILALYCHPQKSARDVRMADIVRDERVPFMSGEGARGESPVAQSFLRFGRSIADVLRFLAAPEQHVLRLLLAGGFVVEIVNEAYDGGMIVKHVLGGSDDAVRHSMLLWKAGGVAIAFLVPLFTRWVGGIGRIFIVAMLLDGLVVAMAGRIAGAQLSMAIAPFAMAIFTDDMLTNVSANMNGLATNSASSTALRGRIMGTMFFAVILGDMAVEALAAVVAKRIGIPAMVERLGLVQVAVVLLIALIGGRRLWSFGLHPDAVRAPSLPPPVGSEQTAP